ncbi:unnamed protein product [Arctia plantaginis]|uniref:Major facilitator superfamily (MFS) profile domain-containing protein n=1 Tax=Arctia plantaginis TaxID=874455 RepID=A0A8S1BA89_ARCPL|nr:unnamed protein product [Arctia plantaginis]
MTDRKGRVTPFLKQCFVTSAVGINLIGHGSITGYPAVLLPQLSQPGSNIISSDTTNSWIASVLPITLFIGSFITPPIMDRFGRKIAHFLISATSAIGWFMTSLASSVEVILIARIISGLSFGMMLPLRSVLIGEYTSPKNRGSFLTTISLTVGLGIFFVHLIGSLISWHKTAVIVLFLPLTSLLMTFFIPESPSYLASKGNYEKCEQAFRWLRGDEEEEEELKTMIEARIEFDSNTKGQKKIYILGNIRKREFYKPIILMLHMYAITHLCGATVIATFSTTIIKLIMNPDVNADVWMVVLDTERIIINALAIFIMKKFKRRTMLFTTGSICTLCMSALSGYVYAKSSGLLTHDILWIPGALMILQFFTIAVALVPLPSVIAGEVFPLQFRSIAGTISLISTSGTMFLLLKTFPFLVGSIRISGTYSLYAAGMVYCLVVAWIMLPETKDRTLQDIEDEYTGRVRNKNVEETETLKTNATEPN